MTQIELTFADGELIETVFSHPLLERQLICVRGRTSGAHTHAGSFQWSPAVRALSTLLTQSRLSQINKKHSASIYGNKGSPASSLDYAIDKKPNWLLDIFGVAASGDPLSSRLFLRTNPGRKRPGQVRICLNANLQIVIREDGELLSTESKLESLLTRMNQSTSIGRDLPYQRSSTLTSSTHG